MRPIAKLLDMKTLCDVRKVLLVCIANYMCHTSLLVLNFNVCLGNWLLELLLRGGLSVIPNNLLIPFTLYIMCDKCKKNLKSIWLLSPAFLDKPTNKVFTFVTLVLTIKKRKQINRAFSTWIQHAWILWVFNDRPKFPYVKSSWNAMIGWQPIK